MNFSCISARVPNSCHSPIAKTALVASAALLLVIGIWQLSSPFMGKSLAAGWAFIGVGGLEAGFVIFLIIKGKEKKESAVEESSPSINSAIPTDSLLSQERRENESLPSENLPVVDSSVQPAQPRKKRKIEIPPTEKLVSSNSWVQSVSKEIWGLIVSFLDVYSIGKLEGTCKYFCYQIKSDQFWTVIRQRSNVDRLFRKRKNLINDYKFQKAIEEGKVSLKTIKTPVLDAHPFYADDLLFTADQKGIGIWKFETNSESWNNLHVIHTTQPASVLFYREKTLFSVSNDNIISIWKIDIQTGKEEYLHSLDHDNIITKLSYGNEMLFSGDFSGVVKIWKQNDERSWSCINTIHTNFGYITSLFYNDQRLVVAGANNYGVKSYQIWEPLGDSEKWNCILDQKLRWRFGLGALYSISGYIIEGEQSLNILKADKKDGGYTNCQTLNFDSNTTVLYDLFVSRNILFASVNKAEIWVARPLNKESQWKWVKKFKTDFTCRSLFYADGKLFAVSNNQIKVWSAET